LLGDAFSHQLRIQFGLAYFRHRDMRGHAHQLGHIATEGLDVLSLLSNNDAWTSGMNRDACRLCGALDLDTADRCMGKALVQELPNIEVGFQLLCVSAFVRVPGGIPVLGNAKADAGWMYFLTHY